MCVLGISMAQSERLHNALSPDHAVIIYFVILNSRVGREFYKDPFLVFFIPLSLFAVQVFVILKCDHFCDTGLIFDRL